MEENPDKTDESTDAREQSPSSQQHGGGGDNHKRGRSPSQEATPSRRGSRGSRASSDARSESPFRRRSGSVQPREHDLVFDRQSMNIIHRGGQCEVCDAYEEHMFRMARYNEDGYRNARWERDRERRSLLTQLDEQTEKILGMRREIYSLRERLSEGHRDKRRKVTHREAPEPAKMEVDDGPAGTSVPPPPAPTARTVADLDLSRMEPGLMRDSLQRQQDQLRLRQEETRGQVQPHPPTHPQRTAPPMVFDNEPPTADVLSGQYIELPPRPSQINRSAVPGQDIGSSGRIWGLDVNGWPVDIHNHLVQWWKDGQRVMRPQTMPLIEVNGLEPSSDYRFGHLAGLDRSGWPIDDNGVRFPAYAEELRDVYDDSGMDDDSEVEEEKKRREKKRAARAYRKDALRRAEEQGPASNDAEFPPLGQPGRPFTPLPAKSLAPPKGKKALRNAALGLPPPVGFRPLEGRADPSTTKEVDELFQRAEGNSNRGRAFTQRARTWVSRLQARAAHEKANNRSSTLTAVEKYALKTWRRPAWLVKEEQGNAPTKPSKAPATKPPAPSKPAAGPSQPTLADPPQAWINWASQLGRTIRGVPRAPNGRWPMRNLRGMHNLNGLLNHDMREFNVNLIGLNAWTAHYAQLIQELGLQINPNRTYVRYRGEYDGGFPPMAMAHRAARWLADRGVTLAEAGDNHAFASPVPVVVL
ncbi:hypothetical protein PLICRDRAFT_181030 [Plicaturopsis crispa FD-325 SS-3]|uniref:Uncharacterized protein n=1 Tax=Plicaturopsis crispa FD-325 SS-3 TaxID=944288 RepID=A0A0C9T0Y3_PLICR|nr:hypothetical protein PLICRDRAFT_181030 [Plicaturopsis crispa FD-325 SS-3]